MGGADFSMCGIGCYNWCSSAKSRETIPGKFKFGLIWKRHVAIQESPHSIWRGQASCCRELLVKTCNFESVKTHLIMIPWDFLISLLCFVISHQELNISLVCILIAQTCCWKSITPWLEEALTLFYKEPSGTRQISFLWQMFSLSAALFFFFFARLTNMGTWMEKSG